MHLRGDLQGIALGDLLQMLIQSHREGILTLQGPDYKKLIHCCSNGIALLNPEILNENRLGEMMVAVGLVDKKDIKQLSLEQNNISQTGMAFVKAGFIDDEQLKSLIRNRLEEEIFCLFEITSGEFEFNTCHEKIHFAEKYNLPVFDMMGMMLEAARRRDEWLYIQETIKDIDTVFIEIPEQKNENDPEAMIVLKLLNGRRTIRNISDGLLMSYLDVSKILAKLVQKHRIRPAEDHEILALARDLIANGEETRGGVILSQLKPNLKKIAGDEDATDLANLFHKAGDPTTAIEILIRKFRESGEKGIHEESIDLLHLAHKIDPENVDILNELVKTYANAGDKNSQIRYLIESARTLLKTERFDDAMQVFSKILILKPEDTFPMNNLPECDVKTDDIQSAVQFLERFVTENIPDFLVNANDHQGAMNFLEKLVYELGFVGNPRQIASIYRLLVQNDLTPNEYSREDEDVSLTRNGC